MKPFKVVGFDFDLMRFVFRRRYVSEKDYEILREHKNSHYLKELILTDNLNTADKNNKRLCDIVNKLTAIAVSSHPLSERIASTVEINTKYKGNCRHIFYEHFQYDMPICMICGKEK